MIGAARLRLRPLSVAAVGCLAAAVLAGEAPPLTDEDVVRMVAAGTPEGEIVRTLEEREVRFDLSEEMVVELRLAGVPERVIGAMRARQARSEPPPATPKQVVAPRETLATVHVSIVAARSAEPAIWIPTTAGDAMAKALQLGSTPQNRRIDGVALFVACTTADHVPDQWRIRSPLGRDFVSMPRHEMLVLQAGALRVPKKDVPAGLRSGSDAEWLRLDLPVDLSAPLLPEVAHDLVVGVAVLVGETYLAIDLDEHRDVMAPMPSGPLRVSVGRQDGRSGALEIRFVAPPP